MVYLVHLDGKLQLAEVVVLAALIVQPLFVLLALLRSSLAEVDPDLHVASLPLDLLDL